MIALLERAKPVQRAIANQKPFRRHRMPEQLTIDERLTAVEKELAELKERLEHQQRDEQREKDGSWIERIAGTFRDVPEFDEIVRLGREFRRSVE
jgi:hypothetical protein